MLYGYLIMEQCNLTIIPIVFRVLFGLIALCIVPSCNIIQDVQKMQVKLCKMVWYDNWICKKKSNACKISEFHNNHENVGEVFQTSFSRQGWYGRDIVASDIEVWNRGDYCWIWRALCAPTNRLTFSVINIDRSDHFTLIMMVCLSSLSLYVWKQNDEL